MGVFMRTSQTIVSQNLAYKKIKTTVAHNSLYSFKQLLTPYNVCNHIDYREL